MNAMGGVFEITSSPGQGTTARLSLSLRASPESSQKAFANQDLFLAIPLPRGIKHLLPRATLHSQNKAIRY